jgi:SnoaL-like domain
MRGKGKAACVAFCGSWFDAFPDARVEVHGVHIIGDLAVEEGTFTGQSTASFPDRGQPPALSRRGAPHG